MASPKRPLYIQPLPFLKGGLGNVAGLRDAIALRPISPSILVALHCEVVQQIDRMAVAQAMMELCRTYAVRPTGDHLLIAVFRAVRATVQAHYRKPLQREEVTSTTIAYLPFVFSELLLGLSAVHAKWTLVAHAPALTLLPILLEAKGRAHPTLLRVARREKPYLPTESEVRDSKAFAYAIGWTVGWLQTQDIPRTASNAKVFDVGNESLTVFEKAYEDALYGRVDLDEMDRFVSDGRYLVSQLDKATLAYVGREAAEAPFDAASLLLEMHPTIAAAMRCDAILADEAKYRELRTLLEGALRELPDKQRLAWHLHYANGMPISDVARAMNVSKNTARTHLHRAKEFVARGDFFYTLQDLANECEDQLLFMDLISIALGSEALADTKAGLEVDLKDTGVRSKAFKGGATSD